VQTNGQTLLPFNNETIQYEIIFASRREMGANAKPSRYLIQVKLNDTLREEIRKIKKQQWLALLNDSHFDWAANLMLYDMHQQDAIIYSVVAKDRSLWSELVRKNHLAFWTGFLKN